MLEKVKEKILIMLSDAWASKLAKAAIAYVVGILLAMGINPEVADKFGGSAVDVLTFLLIYLVGLFTTPKSKA